MSLFVFLGPSLPRDAARVLLPDATFLDPVAMGDLYALVSSRARPGDRVGIVDGVFEQVPAVWHKEVLFALESGIQVYGAASMGALRAAELHTFGMIGVGRIFEAYRDGTLEDDDEVVVAHATADAVFRPLSHSMASLRFGLAALRDAGDLDRDAHDRLVADAKAKPYAARSWGALLARARADGLPARAMAALTTLARGFDAKADDARALLRRLAEDEASGPAVPVVDFKLERTAFWIGLVESQEARIVAERRGSPAHDAALAAQTRAAHPERDALLREAALLRLAEAHTRDWSPGFSDLRVAAARLARRHGLSDAAALGRWRAAQSLAAPEAWRELLELEARAERFAGSHATGGERHLVAALQARGVHQAAAAAFDARRARFGGDNAKRLSLDDCGVDADALERWYADRHGPMTPDPERHAHALGFATLREFLAELLVAYLLETNSEDGQRCLAEAARPALTTADGLPPSVERDQLPAKVEAWTNEREIAIA